MQRLYALIFFFVLSQVAMAQDFDSFFGQGSLRFDYYRTGNHDTEMISNDALYHEPFWGGSKVNLIDTFNYGSYKFEVYDSLSHTLIYSRGFSSLFYEWRRTPKSKVLSRSFSESLIFPFPKRSVQVVFYRRGPHLQWLRQYAVYVNPRDYNIVPLLRHKTRSFKINGNNSPDKALDIVLLSEGYTAEQMQQFMKDAKRFKGYLLNVTPFNRYADRINIWVVPVVSAMTGTDIPGKGTYVNTAFSSHFYTFGTERYLNTTDNKAVRDWAANAPYDQIYILANTGKYGGAGIYNFYSICTAGNTASDFVFTHEFGHAFAGLADEYYSSDVSVQDFYDLHEEPWEPNITTLVNFAAKWKDMVDSLTPIPTPERTEYKDKVGAFEGGGYVAKGIYRPCYDCSMKSIRYDYFCPVCRRAIVNMLEFYVH